MVELDAGTVMVGEDEGLAEVGGSVIIVSAGGVGVGRHDDAGSPSASSSFSCLIPVAVNTEPINGTIVSHLKEEGSPGKIPRVGEAGGGLSEISVGGVQGGVAGSQLHTTLRNTGVAVNNEVELISARSCRLSPGTVDGSNTKADNL